MNAPDNLDVIDGERPASPETGGGAPDFPPPAEEERDEAARLAAATERANAALAHAHAVAPGGPIPFDPDWLQRPAGPEASLSSFEQVSARIDDLIERHERSLERAAEPAPVPNGRINSFNSFYSSPPSGPPPFPVEVLPDCFGGLVREGAAAFDIPADYIAVPLLATTAAAIGNRAGLLLKEGWIERPVIWSVVIGQPGSGKSAGLSLARHPLDVLQREARDAWERQKQAWTEGGETGAPPVMDHLYTSDATIEAVTAMHRRSRGLVVIRDEVAGWAASMDAYRKGGDRQTWLSLWSGGAVKVDRKTSEPVILDDPAVSVCGGVQPDRLGLLLGDARVRDGFADRFLLAAPVADPPGWSDERIAPWTIDGVTMAVGALRQRDAPPVEVVFDRAAKERWRAWFAGNVAAQQETSGFEQGWLAKGPRHLARLALVLHMMERPQQAAEPLAERTLDNAIRLFDYFHQHLRPLLPEIEQTLDRLEVRVLVALEAAGPAGLTRTNLMHALSRNESADDLTQALGRLAAIGRASRSVTPSTGSGRPTEVWRAVGV